MGNHMKKIIAAAALAVLGATSAATAADMATKAPMYKAAPVVVSDWTGWYIGINGGYGWADTNNWAIPGTPDTFIGSAKAQGGLVGGQVGYNWQVAPNWVVGIQGDGDWANIRGNATNPLSPDGRCWSGGDQTSDCKTNYKAMGNLTARAGYLILPTTLVYGKAGINFAALDLKVTNVIDITGGTCAPVGTVQPGYNSRSTTQTSFTAGGGIEQKIGNNLTVFGEYDYVDIHGTSTGLNTGGTGGGGCTPDFTSSTTLKPLNIVKFGLNYTFGGPVVAKY
jgi:outer membrane immunogenic protein